MTTELVTKKSTPGDDQAVAIPIVLFHDPNTKIAKAAICDDFCGEVDGFPRSLKFGNRLFARVPHDSFIFWDYLIKESSDRVNWPDIIGVRLYLDDKSPVQFRVRTSPLIALSSNVIVPDNGLFDVLLAQPPAPDGYDTDFSQYFGTQVYACEEAVLLALDNHAPSRYAFPVTCGVCSESTDGEELDTQQMGIA